MDRCGAWPASPCIRRVAVNSNKSGMQYQTCCVPLGRPPQTVPMRCPWCPARLSQDPLGFLPSNSAIRKREMLVAHKVP